MTKRSSKPSDLNSMAAAVVSQQPILKIRATIPTRAKPLPRCSWHASVATGAGRAWGKKLTAQYRSEQAKEPAGAQCGDSSADSPS